MKKAIGILMTVLLLISATAVLFACGAPAEEGDPPGRQTGSPGGSYGGGHNV